MTRYSRGDILRIANIHLIIERLGSGTGNGDAILLGLLIIAVTTGFTALFIDLPLMLLAGAGVISILALALVAGAARIRFNASAAAKIDPGACTEAYNAAPQLHAQCSGSLTISAKQDLPEPASPEIIEQYWISPPFSYVKITRVKGSGLRYVVVEPAITPKEKTILRETYAYLRDVIIFNSPEDRTKDHIDIATVAPIIRNFDPAISENRITVLNYYLRRDLSGFGPLDALMNDPSLEDLSCNGRDLPVFVYRRVHGSLPASVLFHEGELNQFVLKLAQKANKQISLSNPMVDATLPGGARVQITYSDVVSTRGSSFTIRKFRADPMTPLDLISFGTYSAEILAFLWLAIQHRMSILIVGGTASGKTSTMNAISLFIPKNAKVVSLEDTREIQFPHENWLPTLTREINVPGIRGDIDLFSLLKACMRQRPEYIIVGEVRGREAQTPFQAMNTGHATLSTIHAGSVHEAINRLTHDPISVPPVMFTALDLVIVQATYAEGGTRIRRCLSIHEIEVDRNGEVGALPLYEWSAKKNLFERKADRSRVLAEIASHRGWSFEETERQLILREEFLKVRSGTAPMDIHDLASAIQGIE